VRREADAVDHRDVDLICARHDAFTDQLCALVDHPVQTALENLLALKFARLDASCLRMRCQQRIDLGSGRGLRFSS
jgi:hypothetical protein